MEEKGEPGVYGSSSRSKWSGKKQNEAPVVKKLVEA
jgi:hypothetical protein